MASFDNVDGQDVNVVDLAAIRATVKEQLNPPTPTSAAPASPTPTPSINGAGITLDVVNASGRDGAANYLLLAILTLVAGATGDSLGHKRFLQIGLAGVEARVLERRHDGADRRVGLDRTERAGADGRTGIIPGTLWFGGCSG